MQREYVRQPGGDDSGFVACSVELQVFAHTNISIEAAVPSKQRPIIGYAVTRCSFCWRTWRPVEMGQEMCSPGRARDAAAFVRCRSERGCNHAMAPLMGGYPRVEPPWRGAAICSEESDDRSAAIGDSEVTSRADELPNGALDQGDPGTERRRQVRLQRSPSRVHNDDLCRRLLIGHRQGGGEGARIRIDRHDDDGDRRIGHAHRSTRDRDAKSTGEPGLGQRTRPGSSSAIHSPPSST